MFALLVALGCRSDSFESIQGEIDHLFASPSQLFLELGEIKTVEVGALDDAGNPLTFAYEASGFNSSLIEVRRDSSFLPIYVDDTTLAPPAQAERFRFIVEARGYASTSFTISAGGESIVIPVQIIPQTTIEATISNTTPALGEVVTITAPAGTRFSATSVPTVAGAVQPVLVSIAADGSSMDILLPPNLANAAITISDVTSDGAPGLTFAPTTSATVTTTSITSFDGTISNLSPAVNEAVTVTLNAATLAPGATLQLGGGAPTIVGLTASSVSFVAAPGSSGLVFINGIVLDAAPQFPLALPSPDTDTVRVSAGPIPTAAGTDDPGTAPDLTLPAEGLSTVLYDNPTSFDYPAPIFGGAFGDFPSRLYRITVPAETNLTVTLEWGSGEDIGGYYFESDGVTEPAFGPADAHGEGADASPETTTDVLTPGTYLLALVNFSASNPTQLAITLTNEGAAAVRTASSRTVALRKVSK